MDDACLMELNVSALDVLGFSMFDAVLQAMNLVFYIAPSAYTLSKECAWLGGFVSWSGFLRWTLWNLVCSCILTHVYGELCNALVAKGLDIGAAVFERRLQI